MFDYQEFLEDCGIGRIHGCLSKKFNQEFERYLTYHVFRTATGKNGLSMLKLHYEGLKLKEIAERFDTSFQNVQQHIRTAKSGMKVLLTDKEFLELLIQEDVVISDSKTAKKIFSMQKKQKKYSKYHDEAIEEMLMPDRITNALHRAGFHTVEDLLKSGAEEVSKTRYLSDKSMKIIVETLIRKYKAGKEWKFYEH